MNSAALIQIQNEMYDNFILFTHKLDNENLKREQHCKHCNRNGCRMGQIEIIIVTEQKK